METLPILLGVLLVVGAAAFALLPLMRPRQSTDLVMPVAEEPALDRMRLYRAVLDLELDYQTGKLSQADFESLSAELLAQAGDQLQSSDREQHDIDAQVEREIAAARRAFASARASSDGAAVPTGTSETSA
ncbi:MAG: hypothetical protein JO023_16005 [Chloroflexi bacterium]|nr:hypothetical protein [Chloroflexota bacterium]